MSDELKRQAAEHAASLVVGGMKLGLGTGSTAAHFVSALGRRVRAGLDVVGIPTSEATRLQAEREGIRVATLDDVPRLDLTVDGADEFDAQLRLIKGGGGALLREKIVAFASERMLVIADGTKLVSALGGYPLPVEVVPFGLEATRQALLDLMRRQGLEATLRLRTASNGEPFLTDSGHFILDMPLNRIDDPETLAASLNLIPGVVEHGLFIGLATGAILATADGLVELGQI